MVKKIDITISNIQKLGKERLAEFVYEQSIIDSSFEKRLKMELKAPDLYFESNVDSHFC